MKVIIGGLVGLAIGAIGGYFVAKRKFNKELEARIKAIADTKEDLKKIREEAKKQEETTEDREEPTDIPNEGITASVLDKLCEGEEDVETDDTVQSYNPEEIDPYELELETEDEREARLYEAQCRREVEQYISEGHDAYNITEEMYNEPFEGYKKGICMINEEADEAYDADTGEIIEDWHVALGTDWGTIDEERADHNGRIFVRCERLATDYEIDYCIGRWLA